VNGSVLPDGSWEPDDVLVVVAGVELALVAVVVGVVVVGATVGGGWLVPVDVDVDVEELPVPVLLLLWWCAPLLSGSMYCWSPAEGPFAHAAAGPSSATTQRTVSADRSLCQLTLRVLQALRLFVFSDLHTNRGQARRAVGQARDADVVIGAGDFASMHRGLDGMIDILSEITVPTVLVPGNNETDDALRRACAGWTAARVLHGEGTVLEGVEFFGLGGGVPTTPFPWSFDLTEEEAATRLEGCPAGAVLAVHSPPKGYVDVSHGRHLGSEAILRAIERARPALAVCGHIHESQGEEAEIGGTRVVNVGPRGMFFEI
jgi:uncharacterized protein